MLLLRQGGAEQALVWLRKAVQQDTNQAELWHAFGQAAERTCDIKAAVGAYRRAMALAGDVAALYRQIASN